MTEISTQTPGNLPIILDQNKRLSHSLLWQLQRHYFEQQSIQAWSQGIIPHYITSNPFIANAYAKVVFGFFRDCHPATDSSENRPQFDRTQPIYIIELGSGSGRFAYHFLKRFQDIQNYSVCQNSPFQYIMTDFTERNLESWQSHPCLQPFIERGKLDFACFDVEKDREIQLSYSGKILSPDTIKNPVVVLANYVFDSIPQDAFYLENGELYERLVTLSTSQPPAEINTPELLKHLKVTYNNHPVTNPYYNDPDFNQILQDYQQQLTHTTLIFPAAALQCIRNLRHLSRERLLLLSADKGYSQTSALQNRGDPKIAHHGSFSMMVNYHAIGQYIQNQGGQFLTTTHRHSSLDICAFLLGNSPNNYLETQLAYHEAIEKSSPDDFFTLKKGIEKNYQTLNLNQILAYLRLSYWDANIFWGCFPTLMQQVESASESMQEAVYLAIQQVWDNYYPIGEKRNLAFALGTLLSQMQYYPQALQYFDYSLQLYGADADTLYNMGICHYHLEELEEALEQISLSLELKPEFAAAKRMEIHLQKILDPITAAALEEVALEEEKSVQLTQDQMGIESPVNELLSLLQRLDSRLEYALAASEIAYGKSATQDPYRGLHVNSEDVHRSLSDSPGNPLFHPDNAIALPSDFIPADSRLAELQQQFQLSDFDVDIIAIALAPELDRRYERLYAYLQDDVRCKRPSVDLALNLLCPTAAEKLARRIHFAADALLLRHNLLHLVPDPNQPKSTLLAHQLHLDDQVVRFLLQQPGLDARIAPFCQLIQPTLSLDTLPLSPELKQALSALVVEDWQEQKPLLLYFQDLDRAGKRHTAQALAAEVKAPLLAVDLARMVEAKIDFEPTLKLVFREAWFQEALLYLDELDVVQSDEQAMSYQCLIRAISQNQGITILADMQPWTPTATEVVDMITVSFPIPDFTQRRTCWQTHLAAASISLNDPDLDALVDRFRLTPNQIANAVKSACNRARFCAAQSPNTAQPGKQPTLDYLFAAARAQSGHDLATLARKLEPKYSWDDIVLSTDQQTQLRELCNQAKYRHLVHGEWGFESKLSLGKGLNVLFSGLPGTGKTMAAEVIAHELQLDVYKIDLSQIVSKYIGETEKNLNRIFTAAASSNAILLFDEADALFGKRSEVRDSHDRYANLEISYLLQKMEEYEGVAILTTNLRSNMDDAFVRRLRFIIEFSLPTETQRRRIWQQIWPKTTPCSPDLDFDFLARRFEITGANIRNIALAAAYFAADDGGIVNMIHLIRAIRREYQKMGKILREEDFDKYAGLR